MRIRDANPNRILQHRAAIESTSLVQIRDGYSERSLSRFEIVSRGEYEYRYGDGDLFVNPMGSVGYATGHDIRNVIVMDNVSGIGERW